MPRKEHSHAEKSEAAGYIDEAKALGKRHGLTAEAWNGTPGKEYIIFPGDEGQLQALKPEMERRGWHVWPRDEGHENALEFSRYQAPAKPRPSGSGISMDAEPAHLPPTGDTYRYSGPGSLYANNALGLGILFAAVPLVNRGFADADTAQKLLAAAGAMLCAWLVLLPLHWIDITGDAEKLTIRKRFFGAPREIPYSNIKRAAIFTEKGSRGGITKFLGLNFHAGKQMDLFLPARRQLELLAFLKPRCK